MPRSPLPQRHGLDSAWVRSPSVAESDPTWATMRDFLAAKLPMITAERLYEMLTDGRFVDERGGAFTLDSTYRANTMIFFHRDLPNETPPPGQLTVLYRDDNIVVLDKPHFTATIPRGSHVLYSAVVQARRDLGLPELGSAHRLDRLTSGVLLCTVRREVRHLYQSLFEKRLARKTYLAVAPVRPGLIFPVDVRSHIVKYPGELTVVERVDIAPNAHTTVELIDQRAQLGLYRVTPHTGRTHQIRVHMARLGIPIVDDPLYPEVIHQALDDFSAPLQLNAATLEFDDPITGEPRRFESQLTLERWAELADHI